MNILEFVFAVSAVSGATGFIMYAIDKPFKT